MKNKLLSKILCTAGVMGSMLVLTPNIVGATDYIVVKQGESLLNEYTSPYVTVKKIRIDFEGLGMTSEDIGTKEKFMEFLASSGITISEAFSEWGTELESQSITVASLKNSPKSFATSYSFTTEGIAFAKKGVVEFVAYIYRPVGSLNSVYMTEDFTLSYKFVDTESPTFIGLNSSYMVDPDDNLTLEQVLSGVTVEDDSGSLSFTITDDGGYSPTVSGTYNVSLSVSDAAGHTTTATTTVTVTDNLAPVISGYQGVYYTNVDDPVTLDEILSNIVVKDASDPNVKLVIDEDNYSSSDKSLGTYSIKLSATDASSNRAEITIEVIVVDVTNPIVSGRGEYHSKMSDPVTLDDVKKNIYTWDNVDQDMELELVTDNFTGKEQVPGTYTVSFKVVDDSTNESEIFVVTVIVEDDIVPVITGNNKYSVGYSGIITSEYIISKLSATDNITAKPTIRLVEDNYTKYSTLAGTYNMSFEAVDEAGNISALYVVTIDVYDDVPPVFWISNDFFSVDESVTLTHQQIVDVLLRQANIPANTVVAYNVSSTNEYNTNGGNLPGNYAVCYNVKLNDGTTLELLSYVNVVGETEDDPIIEVENPEDVKVEQTKNKFIEFFKGVGDWFSNLWKLIVDFFKNLSLGGCSRKE